MDKNTLIGFVLIAAVLFGFTWYNQPSKEQIEAQRTKDSIENVAKQKAEQQRLLAEKEKQAAKLEEEKTLLHCSLRQEMAQRRRLFWKMRKWPLLFPPKVQLQKRLS